MLDGSEDKDKGVGSYNWKFYGPDVHFWSEQNLPWNIAGTIGTAKSTPRYLWTKKFGLIFLFIHTRYA